MLERMLSLLEKLGVGNEIELLKLLSKLEPAHGQLSSIVAA